MTLSPVLAVVAAGSWRFGLVWSLFSPLFSGGLILFGLCAGMYSHSVRCFVCGSTCIG